MRDHHRAICCFVLAYAYGYALLAFAGGCATSPERRDDDGGAEATCASACAAARGCPGWRGTPGMDETPGTADDASCEDVCGDVQREAKDAPALALPLECVSAVSDHDCDEVAACEER